MELFEIEPFENITVSKYMADVSYSKQYLETLNFDFCLTKL